MNLWDEILARVETKVNRHSFYTWFKPTSFVAEDPDAVTVRVPESGVQGLAHETLRRGDRRSDGRVEKGRACW